MRSNADARHHTAILVFQDVTVVNEIAGNGERNLDKDAVGFAEPGTPVGDRVA